MTNKTPLTHRRRAILMLAAAAAAAGIGFFGATAPASAMAPWWQCTALAGAIRASQHGGELAGNPYLIEQYADHCTVWE